jgi:hypothetical protein
MKLTSALASAPRDTQEGRSACAPFGEHRTLAAYPQCWADLLSRAVAYGGVLLMAAAVHGAEPAVTLSLAIPTVTDVPWIVLSDRVSHFHVVLSSRSSLPLRIWRDSNSWGYYALSFELVAENGTPQTIRRQKTAFTKNGAVSWLLEPQGHLVFDVHLGDKRDWDGVPRAPARCQPFQLRAVFEVAPDDESRKQGVWTGRVVSDVRAVSLCE